MVCLHGLTERKEAMLTVAESFADAGYIGVAPDLAGARAVGRAVHVDGVPREAGHDGAAGHARGHGV